MYFWLVETDELSLINGSFLFDKAYELYCSIHEGILTSAFDPNITFFLV